MITILLTTIIILTIILISINIIQIKIDKIQNNQYHTIKKDNEKLSEMINIYKEFQRYLLRNNYIEILTFEKWYEKYEYENSKTKYRVKYNSLTP